jgi:hypothetical protein
MRDDGLQAIPHSVGTRHPVEITLQNKDGSPPFIPPHCPTTAAEADHCGEILAMVAASSNLPPGSPHRWRASPVA